jgi:hypothetical protein
MDAAPQVKPYACGAANGVPGAQNPRFHHTGDPVDRRRLAFLLKRRNQWIVWDSNPLPRRA